MEWRTLKIPYIYGFKIILTKTAQARS